jgi:hypothetical protein
VSSEQGTDNSEQGTDNSEQGTDNSEQRRIRSVFCPLLSVFCPPPYETGRFLAGTGKSPLKIGQLWPGIGQL